MIVKELDALVASGDALKKAGRAAEEQMAYFKCRDCNSNTAINECCAACGEKQRIRKSGARYFLDCERCATSVLYFTDAARAG